MIDNHAKFAPREWVATHMTCQQATQLLSKVIGQTAAARGEPWTGQLATKVNALDYMDYWDPEDWYRFAPDYDFLCSALRAD
jgi:hypothetical protein